MARFCKLLYAGPAGQLPAAQAVDAMTETINLLVMKYGLLAVLIGCLAEGESVVILGGFFVHQGMFDPVHFASVAFVGAFLGDTGLFFLGRRFAGHPLVERVRRKPGFSHAHRLLNRHPHWFIFLNRYAYGMRAIGGIAVGMSTVRLSSFLVLNAAASMVWVGIFATIGYLGGLGIEKWLGAALHGHQRLIFALIAGVATTLLAWYAAHHFFRNGNGKEGG